MRSPRSCINTIQALKVIGYNPADLDTNRYTINFVICKLCTLLELNFLNCRVFHIFSNFFISAMAKKETHPPIPLTPLQPPPTPPPPSTPSTSSTSTPPPPQPPTVEVGVDDHEDSIFDIPGLGQVVLTRHQNDAGDLLTLGEALDIILSHLVNRIGRENLPDEPPPPA